MRSLVPRVIATVTGIILLASVLITNHLLGIVSQVLLGWIITLAGVAGLLGILNLLAVHADRVRTEKPDWVNSVVLLVAFTGVFIAGFILKPGHHFYTSMVSAVIVPVETSLLALLSISLAVAIIRAIRPGIQFVTILFIGSAMFFLWAATGFVPFQNDNQTQMLLSFFNTIPLGGACGILLGVGLGSLTAGIRTIIRPGAQAGE